jgi:hypothetical protein
MPFKLYHFVSSHVPEHTHQFSLNNLGLARCKADFADLAAAPTMVEKQAPAAATTIYNLARFDMVQGKQQLITLCQCEITT